MDELTTMAMGRIAGSYPPPRHNVLLLSCMDLRLIDELAAFMDKDNLTNRYDHLVLAGAALGVLQRKRPHWRKTFLDHLKIAIELHKPHDIYIVEHRNCGAYRKFLTDFDDSDPEREKREHTKWAAKLKVLLESWWKKLNPKDDKGKSITLGVHGFLMDLRGDVELLDLDKRIRK